MKNWRLLVRSSLHVLAMFFPAVALASGGPAWLRMSYNELPRPDASAIYDSANDRLILFGNMYDTPIGYEPTITTVMALSLGPNPTWTQLQTSGPTPPLRSSASAIYDPVGQRMIIYGGWSSFAYNDVWALSLDSNPTWTQLFPGGINVPAGGDHSAIYDPIGRRMIVCGVGGYSDVYALSLGDTLAWSQITPAGATLAFSRQSAIYDPVGRRMIVDGGMLVWNGSGQDYSAETWALSLDSLPTWSRLTPASGLPPARVRSGAIYDPVRRSLISFGGDDYIPDVSNQVWELSLGPDPEWTQWSPAGGIPIGRARPLCIYHPSGDRMILFGGEGIDSNNNAAALEDTWSLSIGDSSRWTQLSPEGSPPNPASHPSAILDPTSNTMLVFGGGVPTTGVPTTSAASSELREIPLRGPPVWRELHPAGAAPPIPSGHSAILDAAHTRMITFGGIDSVGGPPSNTTWALALGANPAWSRLGPAGTPPAARSGHSAIYDAANGRMIVYGGLSPTLGALGDVWALSLGANPAWTDITPRGLSGGPSPVPRSGHTAIYDAPRGRMIVFGGRDAQGQLLSDARALSLGPNPTWSLITTGAGFPPSRSYQSAIYDPVGQRLVAFGGSDDGWDLNDTWVLPLWKCPATWEQLTPATDPFFDPIFGLPIRRFGHMAVYDSAAARMVIYGGAAAQAYGHCIDDTWGLTLASCPPPMFTTQPQPLAIPYGSTAKFSVTTVNVGAYHWQMNGSPMSDDGGHISGVLTSTLTITNFQATDVGNYSVQVFGCGDNMSDTVALSLGSGCPAAHAAPPHDMAAWWAMEPGPGNSVPDVLNLQGNKHQASLTGGATLVPGFVGTAVRCDGVNDGLHVPSTLSPDLVGASSGLSIDAWVYPRSGSSPAAYRMILDKGLLQHASVTVNGTTALAPGYAFYLCKGGQLGFQMPDSKYDPVRFEPDMSPLAMDAWHHVAVTVNPVPNGGKFYVDGVVVGSFTPSSGILGNLADLYIGQFTPQLGPATADSAFNGDIDEVELFISAVDSSDIRRIWAAGCRGKRRELALLNSVVQLRGSTGQADVCGSVCNFGAIPGNYSWSIQALGPGPGCPSAVPVTFTPSSGSLSVASGDCSGITTSASVVQGFLSASFTDCYRLTVTNLADGEVFTADGALAYLASPVSGKANCSPPQLGSTRRSLRASAIARTTRPQSTEASSAQAHFTVFNDSSASLAFSYQLDTRDPDSGGPSTVLRLNGLPPGTPVAGSVAVPANGSIDVAVGVALDNVQPFLADEIVLSSDLDGSGVREELASTHVHSLADTSLAFTGVEGGASAPMAFRISASPNPFRGSATVVFTLGRLQLVDVGIYDVAGRRIRRLVSGPLASGEHRVDWDGRDEAGRPSAAGLYLVRVRAGGEQLSLRLIRLR